MCRLIAIVRPQGSKDYVLDAFANLDVWLYLYCGQRNEGIAVGLAKWLAPCDILSFLLKFERGMYGGKGVGNALGTNSFVGCAEPHFKPILFRRTS